MSVRIAHFEAIAPGDLFPRHRLHVATAAGRADARLLCPIVLFEVEGRLNVLAQSWPFVAVGDLETFDITITATAGGAPRVHMGVGALEADLLGPLLGQRWPASPHGSRALLYALRRLVSGSVRSEADLALGRAISRRVR